MDMFRKRILSHTILPVSTGQNGKDGELRGPTDSEKTCYGRILHYVMDEIY